MLGGWPAAGRKGSWQFTSWRQIRAQRGPEDCAPRTKASLGLSEAGVDPEPWSRPPPGSPQPLPSTGAPGRLPHVSRPVWRPQRQPRPGPGKAHRERGRPRGWRAGATERSPEGLLEEVAPELELSRPAGTGGAAGKHQPLGPRDGHARSATSGQAGLLKGLAGFVLPFIHFSEKQLLPPFPVPAPCQACNADRAP